MTSNNIYEPLGDLVNNSNEKNRCASEVLTTNEQEDLDDNELDNIPRKGMTFKTEEEIYNFYKEYAISVGFDIVKKSIHTRGDLRYYSLVCNRNGTHKSKSSNPSRASIRINCKAKVNVKVSRNEIYSISKVEIKHNHELSSRKSRRFQRNKRLDIHAKRTLELNDEADIRMHKAINAKGCDDLPFGESECRSYIHKVRELRLGAGDAIALQEFFIRMQKLSENFYYVMDFTEEGHLRNVFWADGRSRAAYESFNDVITFDSTYLTKKYDMPFTPFIGVNHHGHSILLGCALLSSDDTSTYIWLFKCWLECMNGVAPKGIITDQCQGICLAIMEVFPSTVHRLCLWHIIKKIPEKLSTYIEYQSIKKTIKKVVYESLKVEEFEEKWLQMTTTFQLQQNEWLTSLYTYRNMWVPVYLRNSFWAGMSITQKSESMNIFFDGYVTLKTSLRQFVQEYENALRYKVEKENHADFNSFSRTLPLVSDLHIEKQFHAVYTHEIIKKFQAELKGLFYCNASLPRQCGPSTYFEVIDSVLCKDGVSRRDIIYEVEMNEMENTIKCLCGLFQFKGIICRHIVSSMIRHNINSIPEKYILSRWRKDTKRTHNFIRSSYDDFQNNPTMQRYEELRKICCDIAQDGARSIQHFNFLKKHMNEGKRQLAAISAQTWTEHTGTDIPKTNEKVELSPLEKNRSGIPSTISLKSRIEKMSKHKEVTEADIQQEDTTEVEASHEETMSTHLSQVGQNHHLQATPSSAQQPFSYLLFEQSDAI